MRHQTQVPARVAEYFGVSTSPAFDEFPLLAQTFKPGKGWKHYGGRKRLSVSWVRKLRAQGVTSIAVSHAGRVADFTCDEIIKHANRPLLGGRVI